MNLQASATSHDAEDLSFFRMSRFVLEIFDGLKMFRDVAKIGKYVVDQGLDHGHFTRADHLEVDERKNNLSMRISADDRHQEMPRHMKINIDRCTQVPSIDVETPDTRHFGLSRLKTQGQAKLPKCPDEFLT
ncbi:hypothetical protein F2Q70_00029700 [Brassica cretica]|uniref:Uncharacterized protein n=1 Tax=Brassica cretica TaxID=69181 RepID=A0A8S9FFP3_BRACR|nr:hypothetical protein F2Q70_00029700 [Brassica cretica]